MNNVEQIKVENKIGYVSLVGILNEKYPIDRGNYFSLGGYHVLNMWHENFEHLNLKKDYIDAVKFGRGIIIIDNDIPDDYLNNKPCFTGGGGMYKEDRIEVLRYMFPGFDKLKCMCCDSAKHVSVHFDSRTMGASGGINLSSGTCMICDRKVFTHNDMEVSEEVYFKLRDIRESIPYDGTYLAPYKIVTITPDIPDLTNSRYSKKEINPNFYSTIGSKEAESKHEPKSETEPKPETRYTKKHKVGMIKISDLK